MFRLTPSDLDLAKRAVGHHGYSTMLPDLAEWEDITNSWAEVREGLCNIDLDGYHPKRPLIVTAAKNEGSTRRLHLLHPQDMLLYTSLTLLLKNCVEACRVPTEDGRVHSYRASARRDRIYGTTTDLHEGYMACLSQKAHRNDVEFVGVTDIADFYASISQSKFCHLLTEAAQTSREKAAARVTSNFIQRLMADSGKGIPTGPFASRLLAEVILNDVDRYLLATNVDFVRWVDDFNIFAESHAEVQRAVLGLSTWLYAEHGLSLQVSKTHVVDAKTYAADFLTAMDNILNVQVMKILGSAMPYDTEEGEDEPQDMEDTNAMALLEMLVDAVRGGRRVNFRIVDFAARKLRRLLMDRRTSDELLTLLMENLDRLVPSIENVTRLISIIRPRDEHRRREVALWLLRSIEDMGFIDHYAVWVLTIFVRDERWGCVDELIELFCASNSDVVKRYSALAVVKAGQGHRLLGSGAPVSDKSGLVRLALSKGDDSLWWENFWQR